MVDVTVNSTPRTIRLKGHGERFEDKAAGAITPGHLLKWSSSGFVVQTATRGKIPFIVALENELIGLGIDDAYASGDYVQAEFMHVGMWALLVVPANAAAIIPGDYVASNGDGTVIKATNPLIDNTTGTADGTLANVGAAYTQATLNDDFADVAAAINAMNSGLVGMALDTLDNSANAAIARLRVALF